MKHSISTLAILTSIVACAQSPDFVVRSTFSRPVGMSVLLQAESIGDVSVGYPSQWVSDYVSTGITVTKLGIMSSAQGINEKLTEQQQSILRKAEVGSEIVINVIYRTKNAATGTIENRNMSYTLNVVPETVASYKGGEELMKKYLKEHAIDKIDLASMAELSSAIVRFTVGENGKIISSRITRSSGNRDIDQLMVDAINNMPVWIPARIYTGKIVEQEFEFEVGSGIAGC